MSDNATPQEDLDGRYLVEPYLDWVTKQNVPVHQDFGFDLLAVETSDWAWYDAKGCFNHAFGRGDFMANYIVEVLPGKKTRPVKHLFEAFFMVQSGFGSTTVWLPTGEKHTFEWGPKALFAVPLNCEYQIFNSSGREAARISVTNDAPLSFNLYHNEDFILANPCKFPERAGAANQFQGEGEHLEVVRGDGKAKLNLWETNFVPDLTGFKLYDLGERGKGSKNVSFVLADSTMHSHTSEIPVGRYKKAHRHAAGTHVHAVSGEGYSLLWHEGDEKFTEIPWRHGIMYVPPFWMFHQHFNTAPSQARYVACSMGSRRYPFISLRKRSAEGFGSLSIQQGGRQVEYEDQDPRIHRKWLDAIDLSGVTSDMADIFDEPKIRAMDVAKMTGPIYTPQSIGPAV